MVLMVRMVHLSICAGLLMAFGAGAWAQQDNFDGDWGDWGLDPKAKRGHSQEQKESVLELRRQQSERRQTERQTQEPGEPGVEQRSPGRSPQYGAGIQNADANNLHKLDNSSLLDYDVGIKSQSDVLYLPEQPSTLNVFMTFEASVSEWGGAEQERTEEDLTKDVFGREQVIESQEIEEELLEPRSAGFAPMLSEQSMDSNLESVDSKLSEQESFSSELSDRGSVNIESFNSDSLTSEPLDTEPLNFEGMDVAITDPNDTEAEVGLAREPLVEEGIGQVVGLEPSMETEELGHDMHHQELATQSVDIEAELPSDSGMFSDSIGEPMAETALGDSVIDSVIELSVEPEVSFEEPGLEYSNIANIETGLETADFHNSELESNSFQTNEILNIEIETSNLDVLSNEALDSQDLEVDAMNALTIDSELGFESEFNVELEFDATQTLGETIDAGEIEYFERPVSVENRFE